MCISYIGDPTTLEALVIREAQALADDLYEAKIAVASDCKVAIEAIKEGSASPYGAVIHEIIDRASFFNSCSFIHEFRTSNADAHNLDKHALTLGVG